MADPWRYVENILESYQRMYGEVPKKTITPLIPSDHPELDTTLWSRGDQALSDPDWSTTVAHHFGKI